MRNVHLGRSGVVCFIFYFFSPPPFDIIYCVQISSCRDYFANVVAAGCQCRATPFYVDHSDEPKSNQNLNNKIHSPTIIFFLLLLLFYYLAPLFVYSSVIQFGVSIYIFDMIVYNAHSIFIGISFELKFFFYYSGGLK